eukprot:TRINITY_DN12532_c0_g4_i1.p1 TRINITY_DN12532_c0_g4~~TRINITY_DN12532_c0_g4_i1.p1  ORF type:complete len:167 (+),score=29.69 TRINITY_DN12532_c0_g4_i1:449-949(+)
MNENNASEEPTHKNQFIELPPLTKSNSKPTVVTNSSGTGTWKDFVPLPSLPKLSGWLQRQDDALFSTWKKRYFRLEGDKLYWFRNDQELEHLGFISLREVEEVSKRRMDPSKSNLFQLELRLKKSRMFLMKIITATFQIHTFLLKLQHSSLHLVTLQSQNQVKFIV